MPKAARWQAECLAHREWEWVLAELGPEADSGGLVLDSVDPKVEHPVLEQPHPAENLVERERIRMPDRAKARQSGRRQNQNLRPRGSRSSFR